jgi:alpha,alpha-trehalase
MRDMRNGILALIVCLLLVNCTSEQKKKNVETPVQELYGQLFTDVMSCDDLFGEDRFFADSKAFLDLIPNRPLNDILED